LAAYYNEFDAYAAEWLRNLIAAGHIAPGDVDERSIEDVRGDDLRGYTQVHFRRVGVVACARWPVEDVRRVGRIMPSNRSASRHGRAQLTLDICAEMRSAHRRVQAEVVFGICRISTCRSQLVSFVVAVLKVGTHRQQIAHRLLEREFPLVAGGLRVCEDRSGRILGGHHTGAHSATAAHRPEVVVCRPRANRRNSGASAVWGACGEIEGRWADGTCAPCPGAGERNTSC
jgi:hypothetical protein